MNKNKNIRLDSLIDSALEAALINIQDEVIGNPTYMHEHETDLVEEFYQCKEEIRCVVDKYLHKWRKNKAKRE